MPLDGWRSERARLRQRQLEQMQSDIDLTNVTVDLERQLRNEHREIERLKLSEQLAQERLAAEEQKLAATVRRYETGAIDNLEVTRVKAARDDAEVSLLNVRTIASSPTLVTVLFYLPLWISNFYNRLSRR